MHTCEQFTNECPNKSENKPSSSERPTAILRDRKRDGGITLFIFILCYEAPFFHTYTPTTYTKYKYRISGTAASWYTRERSVRFVQTDFKKKKKMNLFVGVSDYEYETLLAKIVMSFDARTTRRYDLMTLLQTL